MQNYIHDFLKSVLGENAAVALRKASDQSSALGTIIGARTIMGWLDLASRWNYEGMIPGVPDSYLKFAKSENGFDGEVCMGGSEYRFDSVDLAHIAASVSVALGVDETPGDLKDSEIGALGENIDLLLKAETLRAAVTPESSEESSENSEESSEESEDDLEKAGFIAQGGAAKPIPPDRPPHDGIAKWQVTQPKRPRKKGATGVKLTMSEAHAKCATCGESQFKGMRFVSCACLRDLPKDMVKTEQTADGFVVSFGDPWTDNDVQVFLDIVKDAQ